jgi:hypothetical protein
MLVWSAAMGYGAAGGLITEAVVMWGRLCDWQRARHASMAGGKPLPAITRFIDPGPDLAVAFTRAVLGCAAGWLLHGQVTGMYAAITVGASAPALLASLGRAATSAEVLQLQPQSPPVPARTHALAPSPDGQRGATE